MYNINYKNNKKAILLCLLLLLFGTFFAIFPFYVPVLNLITKSKMDSKTKATNIDIEYIYNNDYKKTINPIYNYEVDGKQYSCYPLYPNSNNFNINKNIVYYNSNHPQSCITQYETNISLTNILSLLFCIPFIVGLILTYKQTKKLFKIKKLSLNGTLIKDLPYKMEGTGISILEMEVLKPVVEYTLPNGDTKILEGDPRFDKKITDKDGKIDLLIDLNNLDNYFIDFNINRLT